ncbi:glutaredoxin [Oceaniserpentilla sp. 4NH20-0058]|uniref:glutaredoxin family protein n=1 Tax=Oceaniserpentilla sp. 4NH20-0058 TaxID=3127660 RepID=UPI00310AB7F7
MKYFWMAIRFILAQFILLADLLYRPKKVKRSQEKQTVLNEQCKQLALYQYKACPFCVKTRWSMRRNNMSIELRDAKRNPEFAHELESQGGKLKVPCLKITQLDGSSQWMYESKDIIAYLQNIADGTSKIEIEPSLAKAS